LAIGRLIRCAFSRDALHFLIDACVKPFTEAQWHLEDSFVSSEDQNISGGIENRRANLTVVEMVLDFVSFGIFQAIV